MLQNFSKAIVMMGSATSEKISFDDASNSARIDELNRTMLGTLTIFNSSFFLKRGLWRYEDIITPILDSVPAYHLDVYILSHRNG